MNDIATLRKSSRHSKITEQASLYRKDRQLMRKRALAGLRQVKKLKFVDEKRIAPGKQCRHSLKKYFNPQSGFFCCSVSWLIHSSTSVESSPLPALATVG